MQQQHSFPTTNSRSKIAHLEITSLLRVNESYWLEIQATIDQFFEKYSLQPADDYFSHLQPANESVKMHVILDMYCRTIPMVDLGTIEYQVFKVKKNNQLYVVIS